MSSEDIIQFLTNRRIELGISQKELADQLGYTAQLVSNYERNKSLPELSVLCKFCPVLRVTIEDIFTCKVSNKYNGSYNCQFDISKFSKALKLARVAVGLNQVALAKEIGVSAATIISWEKGYSTPKLFQFIKLKEIFNISYEDLYKGTLTSSSPKKKRKRFFIFVFVVFVTTGTAGYTAKTIVNRRNKNNTTIICF